MVKQSFLIVLLLGAIFAQTIQAHPVADSDDESSTSESDTISVDSEETPADANESADETPDIKESADENPAPKKSADRNPDTTEPEDERDSYSPALTCILFENLGCNTECSTIASAFSTKGTGQCIDQQVCECTLQQYANLGDLFETNFNAIDALDAIKKDKNVANQALKILQQPLQTAAQTKQKLREVVGSEIYDKLVIDDKTPAQKLGMIDQTDKLDYDKIKEFVTERLTPVLESSIDQLQSIDYRSKLQEALKNNSVVDKHLQSIVNEVRRTNNKKLADIVDDFLKSNNIEEKKNTEQDDIADAVSYQVIDQFINQIKEKEEPVAEKPSATPAKKKSKSGKKSRHQHQSKNPPRQKRSKNTAKQQTADDDSSVNRFELPGFKAEFNKANRRRKVNKVFETAEYEVDYVKRPCGAIHLIWKKGNDEVEVEIDEDDNITQTWRLPGAEIRLNRKGVKLNQDWDFGKTKYSFKQSAKDEYYGKWVGGKKDAATLKKYQDLIAEWCHENYFLVKEPENCVIY